MTESGHIGIIGAGNMAEAMARGWLRAGIAKADELHVSDPDAKRRAVFEQMGIHASDDNHAVAKQSQTLLLAIKPQHLDEVVSNLKSSVSPKVLVISIAAGIRCARIEKLLGTAQRVVRVMPNTPALIGEAASAVAPGAMATPDDVKATMHLFRALGHAVETDENSMDAVTALSGSGPAYVFRMIEALRDAGVAAGLNANAALELSIQTVYGSAKMLLEGDDEPETLRARVTSPGGTTQAGIKALDDGGFTQAIEAAVQAAKKRSEELSRT